MDNTTLLFIRACKSKDPRTRIESVYRRFYLKANSEEEKQKHIVIILAKVCDTAKIPINFTDIIENMHPDHVFSKFATEPQTYTARARRVLESYIRFTPAVEIEGYVAPAWAKRFYS